MQTESSRSRSIANKFKQDFRLFLQDELTSRCAKNPNYSLRSFAKALDVSPSALSAMLSGKRPITHRMKEKLGLKLGLALSDLKQLKSQPHGNSKQNSDSADVEGFQQLTIDRFAIISEPYHYALLELIKTQGFRWDMKWIAQRLKITASEAKIASERLERVGLLDRNSEGELIDSTKGFSTDIREGLSSPAQRRFQKRSLEQAIEAVERVPIEQRDNTSMTMAVDSRDLLQAKKMIKEFRRRFCSKLEAATRLDEVYQLTISFIPLTNAQGEEK
jgi:uncharacterized protein (TIGR02147 family)